MAESPATETFTAVTETLRTVLRPRRSVLVVFAAFLALFAAYYAQFLLGGPVRGIDTLLGIVNAPISVLTRWIGPGVVPDPLGLFVFLVYYYLLAVGLAWVGRRVWTLVG
jgi:hypothetical protein